MQFKLSHLGDDLPSNLDELKRVLAEPFENWNCGPGDSAIRIRQGELLLFFKVKEGIFILFHPDYSCAEISDGPAIPMTHYIGGDPFPFPSVGLMQESTALRIFEYYIEIGKLLPDYKWTDIYDLIPYEE